MTDDLCKKIKNLLVKIRSKAPDDIFAGTGIVVYESLDNLPIFNLGNESVVEKDSDLFSTILNSSLSTNLFHDGFCMLSASLNLTHKNVYFAPPIDEDVFFDKSLGYGTRYVAALMGSRIKGVLLSAIASNSYGVVIFVDGEIYGKYEI